MQVIKNYSDFSFLAVELLLVPFTEDSLVGALYITGEIGSGHAPHRSKIILHSSAALAGLQMDFQKGCFYFKNMNLRCLLSLVYSFSLSFSLYLSVDGESYENMDGCVYAQPRNNTQKHTLSVDDDGITHTHTPYITKHVCPPHGVNHLWLF